MKRLVLAMILLGGVSAGNAFAEDEIVLECTRTSIKGNQMKEVYEIDFANKKVTGAPEIFYTLDGHNDDGVIYRLEEMSDRYIKFVVTSNRVTLTSYLINRKTGVYTTEWASTNNTGFVGYVSSNGKCRKSEGAGF